MASDALASVLESIDKFLVNPGSIFELDDGETMASNALAFLLESIDELFVRPDSVFIIDVDDGDMMGSLTYNLCVLKNFVNMHEDIRERYERIKYLNSKRKINNEAYQAIISLEEQLTKPAVDAVEVFLGLSQILQQMVNDIDQVYDKAICFSLRTGSDNAGIIVGIEEDAKVIIRRLTTCVGYGLMLSSDCPFQNKSMENPLLKLKVIPLFGEGGIGKTTMAKKVYKDPSIIANFHTRAWIVVSQHHNLKEMLIGILRCVLPITSEISNKKEDQLEQLIRQHLTGVRYLIALDDLLTIGAWDAIRGCFPDSSNGSRILVTTRFKQVALYLSPYPCPMTFLKASFSWELFSSKVFDNWPFTPKEYEFTAKRIVQACRGLPLAIVVIAGLLAKTKDLATWESVAEILDRTDNIVSEILSVSYNYLPRHLKPCFLYFGVFPEDTNIPVEKLVHLWIAEGFVKPLENLSLEEVAESYLHDLIDRDLVQINELSIDSKIKSCMIHDRVHEACVREAEMENSVCTIDENHAPEASRWVSCRTSYWPITRTRYGSCTPDEIRSIFCFGKDVFLPKCRLLYPSLKLLRVLDLSFVKYWQGMPSGTVDLVHLIYLALSTVGSLNKFRFSNLQSLQTLIVTSWEEKRHLQMPSDILHLPQLRHLSLEKGCAQNLPRSIKENLQTLYWLKVASSDQKPNFTLVPNLKEMGIFVQTRLAPDLYPKHMWRNLISSYTI